MYPGVRICMKTIFPLLIIASLFLGTGCGEQAHKEAEKPVVTSVETAPKPRTEFRIVDIDNRSTTLSLTNKRLSVAKVTQPLVLLNLFARWSAPSCGMVPYLDALQKRYPKDCL